VEEGDHGVEIEIAVLAEHGRAAEKSDLPLAIRVDQLVRIAAVIINHRRHLEGDVTGSVEQCLHLCVGLEGPTLDDSEAGRHAAHRHVFGRDRFVVDECRQRFEIAEVALEIVVRGDSGGVGKFHGGRIVLLCERVNPRPLH
jgi:hypothetical protein